MTEKPIVPSFFPETVPTSIFDVITHSVVLRRMLIEAPINVGRRNLATIDENWSESEG